MPRYEFRGNYFTLNINTRHYGDLKRVIYKHRDILTYEIKKYNRNTHKYETYTYELFRIFNMGKYIRFAVYRGLLKPLIDDLIMNNLLDERPTYKELHLRPPPPFLYDFQKLALSNSISDLMRTGTSTIQIATGGGKTEVAVALIKVISEQINIRKHPVFFISLNKFLIHQFTNRCKKYNLMATEVTGETRELSPVTGATIQTLFKSIYDVTKDNTLIKSYKEDKKILSSTSDELSEIEKADTLTPEFKIKLVNVFKNASLVIMDEVQHLPAFTVKQTFNYSPSSLHVGLSATPWRDDGLTNVIYAVTGVPSIKISFSYLARQNYLVPAIITFMLYRPPYSLKTYRLRGSSGWHEINRIITDDAYRYCCVTELVKEIIRYRRTPLLILVRFIDQGKILSDFLKYNNINNIFLYSINTLSQRDYAISQLKQGKIKVLIATTIADEGLDIPELNSLLILSGGKSSVKTYQRVGRVVRPHHNTHYIKKYGYVYDWVDLVHYYNEHSRVREEAYKKEPSWKVYKRFVNYPQCDKYKGKSAIKVISNFLDLEPDKADYIKIHKSTEETIIWEPGD